MGARRNTLLGLLAMAAFVFAGAAAAEDAPSAPPADTSASVVDFDGFLELTTALAPIRQERLVSLSDFNRMAAEPGTVILDTRSAEAFAMGHIDGAVHLNFSDFTDDKLARVIPSKDTRILIYCNNNFSDNVAPVPLKRAPLALNVPTFVNLWGYGYENIYEFADLVETSDPGVNWVAATG